MKKYLLWALSDMLTKIGCGIYGGAMVSYFFNLSLGKSIELPIYFGFIGLGSFLFFVGYLGIWFAKNRNINNPNNF